MRFITSIILIIGCAAAAFGQVTTPTRSALDTREYPVVYDIPATKNVRLTKDVPYSGSLTIDIYSPPGKKPGEQLPAVIFLNAIGDAPDNRVKTWGIYSSWPRLVAAHGMVGISMDADGTRIQECLRELFAFLERDGAKHGIDSRRLGVYAASANVTQSTIYLMDESAAKGIRAAALYYGGPPSPETRIRKDLPVLFIFAESDMQRMGQPAIDLWQRVAQTRAPWTLLFGSGLPHAFDGFSANDDARHVIQQTIAFWKSHLEPMPPQTAAPSAARDILAAIYWNDAPKAAELLGNYLKDNPNDGDAYNQYGRMLVELRRFDEAGAAYEKAFGLGVKHAGVYNGLGNTRLNQKRWQEAIDLLTKAVELGARSSMTYGQIAWAQLNLNKNDDAVRSYQRAFEAGIPPGPNTRGFAYYNMACAYARLKDLDKAFEMLNKAVDEGLAGRNTYERDPDLEALRPDPRFAKLLDRMPRPGN